MVKHTQLNNSSANCRRIVLSVFDHFVGLALKGLTRNYATAEGNYKPAQNSKIINTNGANVISSKKVINLLNTDGLFLNPLRTSENIWLPCFQGV